MKHLILSFLLFSLKVHATDIIVSPHGIDIIKVGDKISLVKKYFKDHFLKEKSVISEGTTIRSIDLFEEPQSQKPLLNFIIDPNQKITGILIYSTRYQTKEGIKVGSTLEAVKRQYKGTITSTEQETLVYYSRDYYTFELDYDFGKYINNKRKVPDSVKVSGIYLFSSK